MFAAQQLHCKVNVLKNNSIIQFVRYNILGTTLFLKDVYIKKKKKALSACFTLGWSGRRFLAVVKLEGNPFPEKSSVRFRNKFLLNRSSQLDCIAIGFRFNLVINVSVKEFFK